VARPDLPTGTVTLLFTDIEGSTRLLHTLGAEAYATALDEHRALLRDAFAAAGGVEVDTQGDAFFVAFSTASGAAEAASTAHEALAPGLVRVRIGLHTGTPTPVAEGYVGEDVNRGARIAALAHGGQTLASAATTALLEGVELRDLGLHRLKDFEGATRVYQLGSGAFAPVRTPGSVDLPTPVTPFLGRQSELLEAISAVLDRDPRVLTIVGPGGAGKTRFSLELARLLAESADGGTVFVPLAPLQDPALILPAIAERLGAGSADAPAIAARVGEKRTRLVIDNVEHLLPDAALTLATLTAAVPELRLIVTSREPLRTQGEEEFDLPPLDDEDAAELFLARARVFRPGIERTSAVDELCRRLDRLPLAVELAAARTKLLTPEALLERLGARLDLLRGTRDADPRHATLEATIAWSYDLLDETEQDAFARLAVFRGGCTLEAAEDVCDIDLDTIASLLDKSLLRRREDGDGRDRYWMLETIRDFARERLLERPEIDAQVRRRHAERILDIAYQAHLSSEIQGEAEPDHALVRAEREDLRAALDWATIYDRVFAAEIVAALEQFWVNNSLREGRERAEILLREPPKLPPLFRARLLRLHGSSLILMGETERGHQTYDEALDLFRQIGDERNEVALLARYAVRAGFTDDSEAVRQLVAEVRTLNETIAHPVVEPQMLSTLATVAHREGDPREALDLTRRSVAAAAASSFRLWELWQLAFQLELELELEHTDDAEVTGRRALVLNRRIHDRRITIWVLTSLARIALLREKFERAGTLWGAVVEDEQADPLANVEEFAAFSAHLRDCSDPTFLAALETGRTLSVEGATAIVLAEAHTLP
jgi:predicted ATPase/class 3 adenylate cyclase